MSQTAHSLESGFKKWAGCTNLDQCVPFKNKRSLKLKHYAMHISYHTGPSSYNQAIL